MQTSFAAQHKFEMLHGVAQIDCRSSDARFAEEVIEHSACWSDKWLSTAIFFVSWLLADEHQLGGCRTGAKHGLRRASMQLASLTAGDRVTKNGQGVICRNPRSG